MPTYEYECRKCGVFDYEQSIHDDALKRCPKCRCKVERLISASSFSLKGGGWYSEGYEKKGGSSTKSDTKSKASDSTPSTTSSTTTAS